MPGEEIFISLFSAIISAKAFHYRTTAYGKHKACDSFIENFIELTDRFLECYQGKYGRIKFESGTENLPFFVITDTNSKKFIDDQIKMLHGELPALINSDDVDLYNLRDEMISELNQFSYLLTFR